MVVNEELENLKKVLPQLVKVLSPGGRLAIISFQSLEDRIVKNFLKENEQLTVLTNKPIIPTEEEVDFNPASRSAKVRVAIKN
jgi:16S rRNA (cytosine1402-N4)-methyltransferase